MQNWKIVWSVEFNFFHIPNTTVNQQQQQQLAKGERDNLKVGPKINV